LQPDAEHSYVIREKYAPRYGTLANKVLYDGSGILLILSLVTMLGTRIAILQLEKKEKEANQRRASRNG